MRMTDRDSLPECHVIPFQRPEIDEDNVTTTSIAAVIAVTILHTEGTSPEDKLLELIEATGEAEVLDADDALAGFEDVPGMDVPIPVNDNQVVSLV